MQTRSSIRAQRAAYDWLQALEGRKLLLEKTRDGAEVAEFMVAVLRGARFRWPELHPRELPGVQLRPTAQQRLVAAQWVAERIWGLPTRNEPVTESSGSFAPPEELQPTDTELRFLEAARELALERAQQEADAGLTPDRSVIMGSDGPLPDDHADGRTPPA